MAALGEIDLTKPFETDHLSPLRRATSMEGDLAILKLAISLGDVEIPLSIPEDPTAWINAEAQQRQEALKVDSPIFSEEELTNLTDALLYPVSHFVL
jgi:hypothetical protein